MIKPKMIQVPDFSEYVGQEFVLTEDVDMRKTKIGRPMKKGVRFIIKKIVNSKITIKVCNTKKELDELGMLDYDINRIIKDHKSTLKTFNKIIKMWKDEPEKFIVDEDSFWNKERDGGRGHCVNTGYYGIPEDHPHKYGMAKAYYHKGKYSNDDTIMTMDYKRIDGKTNIYSYQTGENEYYSKECYEYMAKSEEKTIEGWSKRSAPYKN